MKSVKYKLAAIGIIPVVLFLALIIIIVLPTLRNEIYHSKEIQTRDMVDTGLGILEHYHEQVQNGTLDEAEAQDQALQAIKAMTFGERRQDYFWINDMHPRMIMHPFRPDLEGEDLTALTDPDGLALFVEMVKICRQEGSGFVPYQWQYYADTTRIEPKLSYVALFEPWDWIVGTGVYINDVDDAVAAARNRLLLFTLAIIVVTALAVVFV